VSRCSWAIDTNCDFRQLNIEVRDFGTAGCKDAMIMSRKGSIRLLLQEAFREEIDRFAFFSPKNCSRFCSGRASKLHHVSIGFNMVPATLTTAIT
jgi:hypothetical protein